MAQGVYRIDKPAEYRKAGPTDLIRLLPAPGATALFLPKWHQEILAFGIVDGCFTHLSGPTGVGKSAILEAFAAVAVNFEAVCDGLGFPVRPLHLYPVEMAVHETPGELYQRRALRDGSTFDEPSTLVEALRSAAELSGSGYPLIWLREIGRVHTSSVQSGLLNLMTHGDIVLPCGDRLPGGGIAWVADSNYQVEADAAHTLVPLDDALRRRFEVNLTLDYLEPEQEAEILTHLSNGSSARGAKTRTTRASKRRGRAGGSARGNGSRKRSSAAEGEMARELIAKIVLLGKVVRSHRSEGRLLSVPPPTIYGYLAFLRMSLAMPHLTPAQVASVTIVGNASIDDRKLIPGVVHQAFGLRREEDADDPAVAAGML